MYMSCISRVEKRKNICRKLHILVYSAWTIKKRIFFFSHIDVLRRYRALPLISFEFYWRRAASIRRIRVYTLIALIVNYNNAYLHHFWTERKVPRRNWSGNFCNLFTFLKTSATHLVYRTPGDEVSLLFPRKISIPITSREYRSLARLTNSRDHDSKTSALHRCSMRTAVSRGRAARAPAAFAASVGKAHTEIRMCTSTCMCIRCTWTPRCATTPRLARVARRLTLRAADWETIEGRESAQSFTPCTFYAVANLYHLPAKW